MGAWKRSWIAMLAMAGFIFAANDKAATAQSAPDPLVVSVGSGCICYIGTYVGEERGIFRKHGVELRHAVMSGVQAVAALADGQIHIGGAAPHVIAAALAKGTRLVGLFNDFGEPTGTRPADDILVVITREGSGVRAGHIEDLKGKKIGLNRGTITQMYLFYALAAKGIDGIQDVTLQPTPPAEQVTALASGAVDAIVVYEAIGSHILKTLKNAVLVQRGGNHIEFLDLALVTPQFLTANADRLKRYIAASAEASQYARQHRDEAADIFVKQFPTIDRVTARAALGFVNLDPRISIVTEQRARRSFEFALKIGTVKEVPRFREMLDLRLFNEVASEHPEYFSDLPPIAKNQQLSVQ
jgi:ABC-type nitrate/sulfonate/bicarbonate transport system substrate-binding protein